MWEPQRLRDLLTGIVLPLLASLNKQEEFRLYIGVKHKVWIIVRVFRVLHSEKLNGLYSLPIRPRFTLTALISRRLWCSDRVLRSQEMYTEFLRGNFVGIFFILI
jgi:hypothetical protein